MPRGRRHGQEYPKLLGSLWVFAESSSYRHERYRCPEDGGMGKNTRSYWRLCGFLRSPPATAMSVTGAQRTEAWARIPEATGIFVGFAESSSYRHCEHTEPSAYSRRTALCNNFTTGAIRRMDRRSLWTQKTDHSNADCVIIFEYSGFQGGDPAPISNGLTEPRFATILLRGPYVEWITPPFSYSGFGQFPSHSTIAIANAHGTAVF